MLYDDFKSQGYNRKTALTLTVLWWVFRPIFTLAVWGVRAHDKLRRLGAKHGE